jgi:hypothetical protein
MPKRNLKINPQLFASKPLKEVLNEAIQEKLKELKHDEETKYHLSTEGYYFKYRRRTKPNIIQAFLYKSDNKIVDEVVVSQWPEMGINKEKSHHDVINFFEARLFTGLIK